MNAPQTPGQLLAAIRASLETMHPAFEGFDDAKRYALEKLASLDNMMLEQARASPDASPHAGKIILRGEYAALPSDDSMRVILYLTGHTLKAAAVALENMDQLRSNEVATIIRSAASTLNDIAHN